MKKSMIFFSEFQKELSLVPEFGKKALGAMHKLRKFGTSLFKSGADADIKKKILSNRPTGWMSGKAAMEKRLSLEKKLSLKNRLHQNQ